jgi:HAMP domain-containing protein
VRGIDVLALAASGAVGALVMRWWQQRQRGRARAARRDRAGRRQG